MFLLTFDVQEYRLALHLVVVVRDPVAHSARVVAARALLHALQDEDVGVVDGREDDVGAGVAVAGAALAEDLALE